MQTQITSAAGFRLSHRDGRKVAVLSYAEAIYLASLWGARSVGHQGDLEDGGDRTLCWESELTGLDDNGSRAICTITGIYEVRS